MTETTTQTITRPDGRRIAVYDLTPHATADAPVVLLCHAAPGAGTFDPDPEVTAAGGVRLISLDRPGYGGSDPVTDTFATVDLAADDAAAVLDAVLPTGATAGVVGWSAGGRVACALAARRPDLVHAVVAIATPAPDEEVPWVPDEHRAGIDALRDQPPAVVHAALTEAFGPLTEAGPALVGVGDADAAVLAGDGVTDRLTTMLDASLVQGSAGMVADIAGYSLRPWGFDPADVRVPVLLGYGVADERVPVEHGRWWAKQLPAARLEEVPGVGHMVVVPFWGQALAHLAQRGGADGVAK
jgi:pimeloyl-ACP methyl ester carboxylesterase